ncbi:MAG: long-chain fatty acid--CoA ligase [Propionibacteriaceae bacterium]|jgi:long-chain acyl-CoA synthetase|nr:long-chain fatty acid--CoA ligase [Propionibacteriaceae bacterium]
MTTAEEILKDKPLTIGELLQWRVKKTPYAWAFKYRDADEQWTRVNWKDVGEVVQQLAAGLLSLGLKLEERVAIIAKTRVEWIFADLAVNSAGGATTAIYPNTSGDDFDHIMRDSNSVYVFAEDADQMLKLIQFPDFEKQVRKVILLEGEYQSDKVISWDGLLALGRETLEKHPDAVAKAAAKVTADTLATLVYTSGTTGLPKGVELVHRCWTYESWSVATLGLIETSATLFLWLPLSHVFGKVLTSIQMAIGFTSGVDGRIDKIIPNLADLKPDVMTGAPRIFEKVRAAVMLKFPRNSPKGRIARWAFAVGRDTRPYRLAGKKLPPHLAAAYALADKLVFSQLKEQMGGNIQFLVSGSAKLSRQVLGWFYSAGITIVEGYGLTETTAISFVGHWKEPHFGTVGWPLPGTEVKIAEDGEILIKGPGVMRGYHNNPELTAEVLEDGWFHSGDIGRLDESGSLIITDRKKDLLKTSGGKYVAPAKVETLLAAQVPYVSQVVAVGDGRKYVSALLTMDRDNVLRWARRRGIDLPYQEILENETFRNTIENYIERANARLEKWETVKRFAILPAEFGVADGGVTPSMKIRRAIITQRYKDVVDSLYDEEPAGDDD